MFFDRRGSRAGRRIAVLLAAIVIAGAGSARAQIGSDRYASIVVEARSGSVLSAASPDEARHPASLTKMMTLYMVFEALREGRLSLGSPVEVSAEAASRPPSRLGVPAGSTLTVEQAILALVTKSANDIAAALGEHLGGSEQRFAQMMTLRARSLGMTRTTFRNASGLPDPDQVTTARDMALLGRRLMYDFPDRFAYFSQANFNFRGRTIWNHNRLLTEYDGTDGIKTGYVNDSGFNLVASANRDGVRIIAAVFGGSTGRERDRHMVALLDAGFAQMGVAPRAAMAARTAPPLLVPVARADTLASRRAPVAAARGRPATVAAAPARGRQAVAARPAAAAPRIEQGDAGYRAARARAVTPPRPAPARTAARAAAGPERLPVATAPTPTVRRTVAPTPPLARPGRT